MPPVFRHKKFRPDFGANANAGGELLAQNGVKK
jgi:hypothetical protein